MCSSIIDCHNILLKFRNLLCLILFFFLCFNHVIYANEDPIDLEANEVEYEGEDNKIIRALGNVIITQNNRKIVADRVTYIKEIDQVTAEGNVIVTEIDGSTVTTNKIVFTDHLKRGVIDSFKLHMPDDSVIFGDNAVREDDDIIKLNNASYTSCKIICGQEPTWRIRSKRVKIDNKNNKITYNNAFFDVKGMPVFYTPYFTHPTAKVKRKSGFLSPNIINTSFLGRSVLVPYYFDIAPNKDLTTSVLISSKKNPVIITEFRHLLKNGGYKINTNFTKEDVSKKLKGHLDTKGDFLYQKKINTGFDINLTTDQDYVAQYNIKSNRNNSYNTLTSKLYVNKFAKKEYFKIDTLYFQSLTSNGSLNSLPYALPLMEHYYETDRLDNGSSFSFDTNFVSLHRNEGMDINRLSLTSAWNLPKILDNGSVIDFSTAVRTEAYYYGRSRTKSFNPGTRSRVIPTISTKWRYPLINFMDNKQIIIEPIVSTTITSKKNYSNKIFNSDSQYTELSDTNLFSSERSSGFDLAEYGSSINYGMKSSIQSDENYNINGLIGQSINYLKDDPAQEVNPYYNKKQNSDIVGRLGINYKNKTDFSYRFLLDKKSLSPKRQQFSLVQHVSCFSFKIDYFGLSDNMFYQSNIKNRKEISLEAAVNNYKNWTIALNMRKNLTKRSDILNQNTTGTRLISIGSRIERHSDCVDYVFSIHRDYTSFNNVKPSTTTLFEIKLKNLS